MGHVSRTPSYPPPGLPPPDGGYAGACCSCTVRGRDFFPGVSTPFFFLESNCTEKKRSWEGRDNTGKPDVARGLETALEVRGNNLTERMASKQALPQTASSVARIVLNQFLGGGM